MYQVAKVEICDEGSTVFQTLFKSNCLEDCMNFWCSLQGEDYFVMDKAYSVIPFGKLWSYLNG